MKRPLLVFFLISFCLLVALSALGRAGAAPTVGAVVPALALPDTAGHTHSLSKKGRPVTLLFFCGCAPCHDFARLWGQVQQGGELVSRAPARAAHGPATVVVFLGRADAARAFAAETHLDLSQTLLLCDPSDQVGQKFGVVQCPRVFVTDRARRLAYTSPDDPAPRPSVPVLVSRTLTALRRLPAGNRAAPGKKAVL